MASGPVDEPISPDIARIRTSPITIVMGTYYTDIDSVRFGMTIKSLTRYAQLDLGAGRGVPVVVVDSSPGELGEIIRNLYRELGAIVLMATTSGIGPQNLQGIKFALDMGAARIMRQEPRSTGWPCASSSTR